MFLSVAGEAFKVRPPWSAIKGLKYVGHSNKSKKKFVYNGDDYIKLGFFSAF